VGIAIWITCQFPRTIERSAVRREDSVGFIFHNRPRAVVVLHDVSRSIEGHAESLATVAEVEQFVGHSYTPNPAIESNLVAEHGPNRAEVPRKRVGSTIYTVIFPPSNPARSRAVRSSDYTWTT